MPGPEQRSTTTSPGLTAGAMARSSAAILTRSARILWGSSKRSARLYIWGWPGRLDDLEHSGGKQVARQRKDIGFGDLACNFVCGHDAFQNRVNRPPLAQRRPDLGSDCDELVPLP